MSYDYVVDSSVWVDYFSGSERGNKVKGIIEAKKLATSIIAVAELADKFFRDKIDFSTHLLFIQSRAAILPLNVDLSLKAAKIKGERRKIKSKFGLSDALQYASAQDCGALFLTADNDFVNMPGVLLVRLT